MAKTEIGKIFLEADLELKKDTANYTNPQTLEGKQYWNKLYQKAEELFGYENITIPTLTRPWIVPGEIIIRETSGNAYIYKATLKVLLEQDYLKGSVTYNFTDARSKALNEYSSQLIRELIIPKLTKDINNAKKYAPLRQVYYSLILAQWFKQKYSGKDGLYARLINRKNLNGLTAKIPYSQETYFKAYQESFNKGEYNLEESQYTPYGQIMRSYLSGGIALPNLLGAATTVVSSAVNLPKGVLTTCIPASQQNGSYDNIPGDVVGVDAAAIANTPEESALVVPAAVTAPVGKKGGIGSGLDLDKQAKKYSQAGFVKFRAIMVGVKEGATGWFAKKFSSPGKTQELSTPSAIAPGTWSAERASRYGISLMSRADKEAWIDLYETIVLPILKVAGVTGETYFKFGTVMGSLATTHGNDVELLNWLVEEYRQGRVSRQEMAALIAHEIAHIKNGAATAVSVNEETAHETRDYVEAV
ncbi:MAG: hypothetical protein NTZ48_07650, partial [Candidatus Omnitrophica bacterium]|nr:hypothetical protein [Candidatus Omnitrophota bacterium]